MADWLALCDYALTRGGANTLFELAALKKPALIVPLPKTASRGDQIDNAAYFKKLGAAEVLPQESMNGKSLISALEELKSRRNSIKNALQNAPNIDGTVKIAKILTDYVEKKN